MDLGICPVEDHIFNIFNRANPRGVEESKYVPQDLRPAWNRAKVQNVNYYI